MKNKKYREILKLSKKTNKSFMDIFRAKTNTEESFTEEPLTEEDEMLFMMEEDSPVENEKRETPIFASEQDKIRITMLGTSSSGKTAFLSAVYQTMISNPLTDISLQINEAYDTNEQYHSIQQIAMVRGNEIVDFPPGTNETKSYGLILVGGGKKFCEFEFWDYRGALAKNVIPGRENSQEIEDFRNQLIKSDAILVFADAILISQYPDSDLRRIKCSANDMNHIFNEVLKDHAKDTHVTIVLTKCDDTFVKEEDKADHYKNLCQKAMEIYEPISKRCKSFAIIPVSAVGQGQSITQEAKDSVTREVHWVSRLKGYPKPENVELVILYACRQILENRLARWREELSAKARQCYIMEDSLERKSFIGKILAGNKREEIQKLLLEITEKEKEVNDLERNINHMMDVYEDEFDTYVYYEKKELEDEI